MQNSFHVETSIEEEETKDTIGAEQDDNQSLHVFGLEQLAGQEWLLANPALHVNSDSQEQDANDQRDVDVRRSPTIRCLASVSEGENDQNQSGNDGDDAQPIHLDGLVDSSGVRDAEPTTDHDGGHNDGSNPEEPSPSDEVCGDCSDKDTSIEANAG